MAQPYSFRSRKTQIKGNESYKMQMMINSPRLAAGVHHK